LLVAYLLVPEVRGFPLLMYLAVDAVLGLVASTTIAAPKDVVPASSRSQFVLLAAQTVLVSIALLIWLLVWDRYWVSMTDTVVRRGVESLRVWAVRRRSKDERAAECDGLRTLADSYRNRFKQCGSSLPMRGTIYQFKDNDGAAPLLNVISLDDL
jgi:hypothetical protein